MKASTREIIAWFVAHAIWWIASAVVIFPFVISPLYATMFNSQTPVGQRTFIITLVGLGVAVIGWCVGLAIFLAMRGPGPKASEPPPALNPFVPPQR